MKKFLTATLTAASLFIFANQARAATYHATVRVRYTGRGGVNLMDRNGHYQNKYVYNDQTYKTFEKQIRNHWAYYRLGSDKQWIPAQFVTLENYSQTFEHEGYSADADMVLYDHKTITVYDKSNLRSAVVNALNEWNASHVHFVLTSNPNADVVIQTGAIDNYYAGYLKSKSAITIQSPRRKTNGSCTRSYVMLNPAITRRYNTALQTNTVAHELGHALGLDHASSKNSIMYPVTGNRRVSTGDIAKINAYYR